MPSGDSALRSTPVLTLCLAAALAAQVSDRGRKAHRDAFVFDGHVHVINRQLYHGGDIGDRVPDGQFDLPRAIEGGVDAMFYSVFVTEEYYPARYETRQAFRLVDLALEQLEKNKDKIALALNAADIERINRSGRIAAVLDIEGSADLDGDLGILRDLYRLGLRSMQFSAHNWNTHYGDSCCSPPKNHGLTEHGRAVVRELNRLGMVINISHSSDETIDQILDVSTQPVVATHHGMREFNNIPRNMPEHLMKKLAAKGGVFGFQIGNDFHNRKAFEWRTKNAGKPFWDTEAKKRAQGSIYEIDKIVAPQFPMVGVKTPDEVLYTPDEWLAVVERAIELVGEDHVSLGTDFDGGPNPPRGIRDISHLPLLTDAMLRRGWTEQRIRKFLGGNLLRVFRQITRG
jgi:membrane dipeptidase